MEPKSQNKDIYLSSNIVKEYLDKFPEVANLTLAKKIYKENQIRFNNVEHVRSIIRRCRGAIGSIRRDKLTDKKYLKPLNFSSMIDPFKMPVSHAQAKKTYKFSSKDNNILILSDIHIPYHDIPALTAAINYGKKQKVNAILLNGDIIDCAELSKYEKDPKARKFVEEANSTKQFLEQLRKTFPKAKIVWLKGNHDVRYEKFLYKKAPELFDDPYYKLEERLGLKGLNIQLLDEEYLVYAGKLMITHGHLSVKGIFAPVNPARGIFLKAKASLLIGHCHQVSEHTERTLEDKMISCWSTGCLCTLYQPYDPHNTKHAHGFAHVQVNKNGSYNVYNKRIINGVIL